MPKTYHHNSEFGPGKRVPIDREQRAVWKARLKLWRKPKNLSLGSIAVAEALIGLLGKDGRCDPSYATLAALARVCATTVHDALTRLRQAGFITWTSRLIRSAKTKWRAEQTTNAYALTLPASCNPPNSCDYGNRRGVIKIFIPKKEQSLQQQDMEARENAKRQLQALGMPIPANW